MKTTKQFSALLAAITLLVGIGLQVIPMQQASAAQIFTRSLTLQAGATEGGSKPGGVVNHLFTYSLPSVGNTNVGSIKFEYCTLAAGTCTTPTGLVTTSATMGSQTGVTGFTLVNTTNGAPYVTRTAAAVTANQAVTTQLLSVTNPTTTNQTFFVRISTYASTNVTGGTTDTGTVTASTATQIILDGIMPESLVFCTGQQISTTAGVPDCSTATAGLVSFNQLFSPTDTAIAASQMAASTNAGTGYVVTVNGPTMTSGANTIAALASPTASLKGVAQFGMNLKANTAAAAASFPGSGVYTSADIAVASNGTNFRGQPITGYDTADTFTFVSGATVANSAQANATPVATDAQIYTASYIINVPGSQAAGTYTTTLTYICTPTF